MFMGIGLVGGILWPRANRWGALVSLVTALAANFTLYRLTRQRLDHWDPNVFLAALVAGIAALVVVSLLTPAEPAADVRTFFQRLDTSSDGDEAVKPLMLVNLGRAHRIAAASGWRVFADDLAGFGLAWVWVIALIAATAVFLAVG